MLTPESIDPFMVNPPAQNTQDLGNSTIPIPSVLSTIGLLPYGFHKHGILSRSLQFIPLGRTILPQGPGRLPLTDTQLLQDRLHGLAARSRDHQFFEATSRRIAFSNA
jgi:hypothetical protein